MLRYAVCSCSSAVSCFPDPCPLHVASPARRPFLTVRTQDRSNYVVLPCSSMICASADMAPRAGQLALLALAAGSSETGLPCPKPMRVRVCMVQRFLATPLPLLFPSCHLPTRRIPYYIVCILPDNPRRQERTRRQNPLDNPAEIICHIPTLAMSIASTLRHVHTSTFTVSRHDMDQCRGAAGRPLSRTTLVIIHGPIVQF